MATSKCGHCKSATFEVKEVEPRESRFKLIFVQCASCGVPVGVIDYMCEVHIHRFNFARRKSS